MSKLSNEMWLPLVGYKNIYEVSNIGRVRRAIYSKPAPGTYPGRLLTKSKDNNGYAIVCLRKDGRACTKKVHGLIMSTFCGNKPYNKQVNHKNGDRFDSRLCNLEYVTASENIRHSMIVLKSKRITVLSIKQIASVKKLLASGWSQRKIAKKYNVCQGTISYQRRSFRWNLAA